MIEVYGAGYTAGYHKSDEIKEELLGLNWITKRTARHEYFMSDVDREYTYGGGAGSETYKSQPFSPLVKQLMEKINLERGVRHNVCFLNKYDDEHQHLGWHADDFAGMDHTQPISVLSYGAEREIWLKDKRGWVCPTCLKAEQWNMAGRMVGDPWISQYCDTCDGSGFKPPENGKQPADQRIKLEDGSLFIMHPGYQDTHLHRIPKHDRPCDWRISLTFRTFV